MSQTNPKIKDDFQKKADRSLEIPGVKELCDVCFQNHTVKKR